MYTRGNSATEFTIIPLAFSPRPLLIFTGAVRSKSSKFDFHFLHHALALKPTLFWNEAIHQHQSAGLDATAIPAKLNTAPLPPPAP